MNTHSFPTFFMIPPVVMMINQPAVSTNSFTLLKMCNIWDMGCSLWMRSFHGRTWILQDLYGKTRQEERVLQSPHW
jgi:hypothetical protein